MRIIRTLMLLTGVGVFMPSPPDEQQPQGSQVSTPELIGSATSAFADMAGFCAREPAVCQTAGYVAGKLEAKAKYSVKLIYEWANESTSEPQLSPLANEADGSDQLKTGSTTVAEAKPAGGLGQSTLRLDDLIPEWRAPPANKKS